MKKGELMKNQDKPRLSFNVRFDHNEKAKQANLVIRAMRGMQLYQEIHVPIAFIPDFIKLVAQGMAAALNEVLTKNKSSIIKPNRQQITDLTS